MAKKINYPSDEWIDRYIDAHEGANIKDAEQVWWDNEIDHGNPTPFDLNEEQAENAKEVRRKMAKAVDAYGKQTKRERKPNENKRTIIGWLKALFEGFEMNGKISDLVISNEERSLDFTLDGKSYTLTLTEHRPKKGA